MSPEKAVDAIIREAMKRGEFDNLPGEGKPLDLTDYFNTPEELRLAYSIMKNAGVVPGEIELLNELANLKEILNACSDEQARKKLQKQIEERTLRLNILLERLQKQRK